RLALLGAMIALGLGRTQAQTNSNTNTITFNTNVLLNVSISLNALFQNFTAIQTNEVIFTARPGKVTTRDLINAIGKDLGHGTNTLIGAKLLLRFTYSGTNSSEGFVLRVGTNDIDISN